MRVSVVVRTYNRGYIVGEAIANILAQTHQDLEIVVVDDGSQDDTREIIAGFNSEKIRYIRHDRNRGVAAAANTGVEAASGDVVAFHDSDDLWEPHTLERLVEFLRRHPDAGAVFCDVQLIRPHDRVQSVPRLGDDFRLLLERYGSLDEYVFEQRHMYLCLLQELPIKPIGVLVRRDVFQLVGRFNESLRSGEDWEMFLRITQHIQFGFVDSVLATMRELRDSTFLKYREQDKKSALAIVRAEKRSHKGDNEILQAANRGIYAHSYNLAHLYRYSGRALECFSISLNGFVETGRWRLLARALSSFVPLGVETFLKRSFRER